MPEYHQQALLLRSIPYSESSLIVHVLTADYGRLSLMARGVRRSKSLLRPALAPLFLLDVRWKSGRTGMGTLLDARRGQLLLGEPCHLEGLELLSVINRVFPEEGGSGFQVACQALEMLGQRSDAAGICAAQWFVFSQAGWLGSFDHCWHCGVDVVGKPIRWQKGHLLCCNCSKGNDVSQSLRKSIEAMQNFNGFCNLRFSEQDISQWRWMIQDALRWHHISS